MEGLVWGEKKVVFDTVHEGVANTQSREQRVEKTEERREEKKERKERNEKRDKIREDKNRAEEKIV